MPPEISPEGAAVSPADPHDDKDESTTADVVAPPQQVSHGLPTRPESLPPISSIAPPPAPGAAPPVTASSASPALPSQPQPPQPADRQNGIHPASPMMPQQPQAPAPLFGVLKTRNTQDDPPPPRPPPTHHHHHHHQQQQQQQQQRIPTISAGSPEKSYAELNDKWFLSHCDQLSHCIQGVSAPAVRRVVRDNWQKCLLGSDYHTAFIMNAVVHHGGAGALQRGMRDFGETLVHATKVQIAGHMSPWLLDELADILLSKASPRFLDKAVAKRLPTIPAKTLLNSLARAERLGYDANDIEEEDDEPEILPAPPAPTVPLQPERLPLPIPNPMHIQQLSQRPVQSQQPAQLQTPPQIQQPARVQPPMQGQAQLASRGVVPNGTSQTPKCVYCGRVFEAPSSHAWHIKKRVCRKPAPVGKGYHSRCDHCDQGFSSPMGLQYHTAHKVCGDFTGVPPATAPSSVPPIPRAPLPAIKPSTATMPPQPMPHPHLVRPVVPSPSSSVPPTSSIPPSSARPSTAVPTPAPSHLIQSDIPAYRPLVPTTANPPQTPAPPSSQSQEMDNYNSSASRAAAHLTPGQKQKFDIEMSMAEESFKLKIEEARKSWEPSDLERRLTSLKNSHATKQSQIRKKYGIRLRSRRGPTAMAAERDRLGLGETPVKNSTFTGPPSTPQQPAPAERTPSSSQWTAANVPRPDSLKRPFEANSSPQQQPPVKKLAVSQLTSGLAGSSATAAMQDPTMQSSPSGARPHSSHGHPRPAGAERISMGIAGRGVSREEPVEVDSSSDSGSDIPAE